MELARQYIRRADGLWRRHKVRATMLAVAAGSCAAWWLVKQAVTWILSHVRAGRQGETDEH